MEIIFTAFLVVYVLPVVVFWLLWLPSLTKSGKISEDNQDYDKLLMILSLVPGVNLYILAKALDNVWAKFKEKYFRDEFE